MITIELPILSLNKEQATDVQKRLKDLDYYKREVDGISGKNTAAAWADFKADNWLGKTELIGPASYRLLVGLSKKAPAASSINWKDFNSKVSKYFTVGEVALHQQDRLPTNPTHQANAVKLAIKLDAVRDWWGSSLLVTSWYRPPHVERRVGGSFANHPYGYAVDIYPAKGSIWDFQRRFEQEWYNTGKWQGGFGRGAKKGFLHLDTRSRRIWDY